MHLMQGNMAAIVDIATHNCHIPTSPSNRRTQLFRANLRQPLEK
jgi:hypothetical protein